MVLWQHAKKHTVQVNPLAPRGPLGPPKGPVGPLRAGGRRAVAPTRTPLVSTHPPKIAIPLLGGNRRSQAFPVEKIHQAEGSPLLWGIRGLGGNRGE